MRNPDLSSKELIADAHRAGDIAVLVEGLEKIDALSAEIGDVALSRASAIHDRNGNLLWASAKTKALFAKPCDSQLDTLIELVHVQDRVKVAQFLSCQQLVSDPQSTCVFRPASQESDRGASWIEAGMSNVAGKLSTEIFSILTFRDISKAKEIELAADSLREKAEQANVAKSQFLANISHELRTPLNAILGFSELLNSPLIQSFSQEKQGEYIGLIHDSASHLLNVLNGILDMSKIENGMYEIFPQAFDLTNCLTNTTAIMRGQAALKSIQLATTGFDDLPEIIADERAVKQIVINLLANAIKFSDDNGQVRVSCERRARTIHLTVSDNGIGISPEHLENLGTPFFQADSKYDRKYEGTGLGLSVVKGLVELHKGRMKFDSKRGLGTTVTVVLPIYGQSGRQMPGSSEVEKITAIHSDQHGEEQVLRILRNTA